MKFAKILFIISLSSLSWLNAQISGVVFRDYNANGVKNNSATFNEVFVAGVKIKAYNNAGVLVDSAITNASGAYSFSGLTLPTRIEFTNYLSGDYSGPVGSGNSSSVQFYSAATTSANFAVNLPAEYFGSTPTLVTVVQEGGGRIGNSDGAMVSWPYNNSGLTPAPSANATIEQIGATWGLAIQKNKKYYYASALVKRFADIGPRGYDGVYVFDYAGATPTLVGGFDLQGITPSNGGSAIDLGTVTRVSTPSTDDNFLNPDKTKPSYDIDAFGKAGRTGYGDIDMSEDEKTLWLVNLNQIALISVDVSSYTPSMTIPIAPTGTVKQFPLSTLPNWPACSNGVVRPWGLKFYHGKGYLGVVCTGENGLRTDYSTMWAYVLSFDPNNLAAGFTVEVDFSLNYDRETQGQTKANWAPSSRLWVPWQNVWPSDYTGTSDRGAAQGLVSDIEFNEQGNMIIGMLDRWGLQVGLKNRPAVSGSTVLVTGRTSGDVIGACSNGLGGFILEGGTSCANVESAAVGLPTGKRLVDNPAGNGEYYYGDYFLLSGSFHMETSIGALAVYPGTGEVALTSWDAKGTDFFTQGVNFLRTTEGASDQGAQVDGYLIVNTNINNTIFGWGKSSGLGDIELLSEPPPIEIGNRVWLDSDSDGIQDAGESPIAGVTVELVKGGIAIATAVTNATGNYYFSNATGTTTSSSIYNIAGLMADMAYTVRIPNISGGSKQAALGTNSLTLSNVGGSGQPDVRDNDGVVVGVNAEASVLTSDIPISGANNHNFDFGFSSLLIAPCSISSITATPGTCVSATNQYTLDGTITFTNPPATGTLTVQITGGGSQVFNAPFTSAQNYSIPGQNADGAIHTVTATFSADVNCSSNTTYTAPIACGCSQIINTICNDGSETYTLTAQSGYTNIFWYDSTSNSLIGIGSPLMINGTEPSLADGYESFYVVGDNSSGCITLGCCPVRVSTKSCLSCIASLTINSTQCNNNNTQGNGADDWFTLNLTGTVTGGSGNYVIKIGAYTSPSTPSGTSISITGNGQGANPLLKADGVTTYSVTIEDATNSACYNTITVGPVQSCSSCPNPNCFTVTKQKF